MAKKTMKNDAITAGTLVTRFKIGQINGEDPGKMAANTSRAEKCSAARKVLDAIEDSA